MSQAIPSSIRCYACSERSQKRFQVGRSLKMHIIEKHLTDSNLFKDFEKKYIKSETKTARIPDYYTKDLFYKQFEKKCIELTIEFEKSQKKKLTKRLLNSSEKKIENIFQDDIVSIEITNTVKKAKNANKQSPLKKKSWIEYAKTGQVDALDKLRSQDLWHWANKDQHGSTAEHYAAGAGQLNLLKYCLVQKFKECPMHSSLIPRLHPYNHNVDYLFVQDIKPLNCFCQGLLRKRKDGRSSLHWAARNGHVSIIDFLIKECEENVNIATFDGTTPLMYAVFGAQIEAAKALVRNGANFSKKNSWNCSLTHWIAISRCRDEAKVQTICDWIDQELELDFSASQKQGRTPLHKAAFVGNFPVVRWILSNKKYKDALMVFDAAGKKPVDLALDASKIDLAEEMNFFKKKNLL